MTTVPIAGSSSATTNQSQINNALASLASNSQTFLTLLTTQLKNQDPTSPMDTNQFTAQLTQMTGVEQQVLSNQLLQQLISQSSGAGLSGAVGLLGKTVTASGSSAVLQSGAANWQYTLGGQAANVTVQVSDSTGKVVYSGTAPAGTGPQSFTWSGQNSAGQQQQNGGVYTLSIAATDASGAAVPVSNSIQGTATAIEQVDGQTMVTIGGAQAPLTNVTAVN